MPKLYSHPWLLIAAGLMLLAASGIGWYFLENQRQDEVANTSASSNNTPTDTPTPSTSSNNTISNTAPTNSTTTPEKPTATLAEPIAEFQKRITKKRFGTYVSPKNSPVQPERFTGYHTAVDIEYADVTQDVPVYALTDSRVVVSRVVDGYGGVFILQFSWKEKTYTALYGHIRPSTLPKVGATFKRGDKIALIGTAYSSETDGERRHLHFSIHPGTATPLTGYVQSQSELAGWIDPLSFY